VDAMTIESLSYAGSGAQWRFGYAAPKLAAADLLGL
jgi:hypothetical protein